MQCTVKPSITTLIILIMIHTWSSTQGMQYSYKTRSLRLAVVISNWRVLSSAGDNSYNSGQMSASQSAPRVTFQSTHSTAYYSTSDVSVILPVQLTDASFYRSNLTKVINLTFNCEWWYIWRFCSCEQDIIFANNQIIFS